MDAFEVIKKHILDLEKGQEYEVMALGLVHNLNSEPTLLITEEYGGIDGRLSFIPFAVPIFI